MILKKISLSGFRNFENSSFDFSPLLTIIIGKNSVGKTNLLEAIFFICRGRGFREDRQEELIRSGKTKTEVEAFFTKDEDEKLQFRVSLNSAETVNKIYQLNKIKKRAADYLRDASAVVIFSPSFMYLIDSTQAHRREFFDQVISLIDPEYKKNLINYETGLRKRNKILESARDIDKLPAELSFWDDYLIKEADYIVKKRDELAEFLNSHKSLESKIFSITYTKNIISHHTLAENFKRQFYLKKTIVGPQRDTYEIYLKDGSEEKNIHKFGSRSEQRLALFWIVVNEIKLYEDALNRRPMVLLDDIFSELDLTNKALVLKLIKNYQTVVTTTEHEILSLIGDIPHTIINL